MYKCVFTTLPVEPATDTLWVASSPGTGILEQRYAVMIQRTGRRGARWNSVVQNACIFSTDAVTFWKGAQLACDGRLQSLGCYWCAVAVEISGCSETHHFQGRERNTFNSFGYQQLPFCLLTLLWVNTGRPGAAYEPGQPCPEQISASWSRCGKQFLGWTGDLAA